MDVILWWCLTPSLLWYPCICQEMRKMLNPSRTRIYIAIFCACCSQKQGGITMEIQTEDCSWCCKSASVLARRVSGRLHRPSGHATQQHSSHSWLHTHGGRLWSRPAANEWRDGGRNACPWYFGVSQQCLHICSLFRDPNARWGTRSGE